MTHALQTMQTLIFTKLESILKEVRDLSNRVSKLEALVNMVAPAQEPSGKNPELIAADKLFNSDSFPSDIGDKLAYATGYLAGRMGILADKTALDFGPPEYRDGYALGQSVATGEIDPPSWDKTL
jgi:hypothetical protein